MSDTINAQHEETGRMWSGSRGELPKGYSEVRMTEQAENELICLRLLGWTKHEQPAAVPAVLWAVAMEEELGWVMKETPTFGTWAEAGMILEALYSKSLRVSVDLYPSGIWRVRIAPWQEGEASESSTGPLAIRSAALAYLRAQE